jgi:hypothetical protein
MSSGGATAKAFAENVGTSSVQPSPRNPSITASAPPSRRPKDRSDEWTHTVVPESPRVRIPSRISPRPTAAAIRQC